MGKWTLLLGLLVRSVAFLSQLLLLFRGIYLNFGHVAI